MELNRHLEAHMLYEQITEYKQKLADADTFFKNYNNKRKAPATFYLVEESQKEGFSQVPEVGLKLDLRFVDLILMGSYATWLKESLDIVEKKFAAL